MAKWKKQSHCVYQCKYHLVWCPKYRFRVLTGDVAKFVDEALRALCEWKKVEVLELNVQPDHVHAVLQIPPRLSVSEVVGTLKGKTAIKVFKSYPGLKKKPYWGNHFWARGYCVTTISASFRGLSQQSHLLRGWSFTRDLGKPLCVEGADIAWELLIG